MALARFGRSAIRLDQVICIRAESAREDAELGKSPARVRIVFRGCRSVTLEGADAEAVRAFVASLGEPPDPSPCVGYSADSDAPPSQVREGGEGK
jgi:hypothetical protein